MGDGRVGEQPLHVGMGDGQDRPTTIVSTAMAATPRRHYNREASTPSSGAQDRTEGGQLGGRAMKPVTGLGAPW